MIILLTHGNSDLTIGGNLCNSEVETSRNDASLGFLLFGNEEENFISVNASKRGLYIDRDIKALELIDLGRKRKRRKSSFSRI